MPARRGPITLRLLENEPFSSDSLTGPASSFSTAFHSRNRTSCDEQPLPSIQKAHNGIVRENFLNSAGQSAPASYPLDLGDSPVPRNTSTLSPYSALFCHQNGLPSDCNRKKENDLPESARENGFGPSANSLFLNILRISHSDSIFYPESRISKGCNIKKTWILPKRRIKN
jgi:hypothetical protein